MRFLSVIVVASLFVSSCGANRGDSRKDKEIQEVLDSGLSDLKRFNVDTSKVLNIDSYVFDNLPSDVNGSCQYPGKDLPFNVGQVDTGNHIIINRDNWNRYDLYHRKIIILHEAGHCAWGKRHEESGVMQSNLPFFYEDWQYWKLIEDFALELPHKG